MNSAEILAFASNHDIRLSVIGGRLRVDAPPGLLTDDLREEMVANKAAIISELSVAENLRESFEERAAIAEHDGGLSRADAEQMVSRIAWRYRCEGGAAGTIITPCESEAQVIEGLEHFHGAKVIELRRISPCSNQRGSK
tara:strand:- start:291 stop:710 length:420 start_codon:yes stop_codon:yes gene_type:complete